VVSLSRLLNKGPYSLECFSLAGQGVIMAINDADSPPDFHLLESFNFSPSDLAPISSLHWAATEESYIPPDLPLEIPDNTPKSKSTREQAKMKKRRATFDKSQASRDDFLTGDFDASVPPSCLLVPSLTLSFIV
jgi:tRNA (adenine-N(1)-)-methyltransferase non-catalytic subunit